MVARFGEWRTERPSPPSRAAVLRAMDTCGIWHFACHGVHRRTDPLESSLVLSDGRLTLRAIFARPAGPRRLAVLSACRTAAPDSGLLDEVVSFPSALLQSGVAGVVCAQSDIVDRAAMLLVLRFFAELEQDDAPPRALARAQAWLRTATNGQIHAGLRRRLSASDRTTLRQELADWMRAARVHRPDLLGAAELHGRLSRAAPGPRRARHGERTRPRGRGPPCHRHSNKPR